MLHWFELSFHIHWVETEAIDVPPTERIEFSQEFIGNVISSSDQTAKRLGHRDYVVQNQYVSDQVM